MDNSVPRALGCVLMMLLLTACGDARLDVQQVSSQSGAAYFLRTSGQGDPVVGRVDLDAETTDVLWELSSPPSESAILPDVAVAEDGLRLFAAYEDKNGQELVVLDSSSGEVLDSEPVSGLQGNQIPTDYLFPFADGVVAYQSEQDGPGATEASLVTYDWSTGSFLPEKVQLGNCGALGMAAAVSDRTIAVQCGRQSELRIISISETGAVSQESTVALPSSRFKYQEVSDHVVSLTAADDGALVYLVTQDGQIFTIDVAESALVAKDQLPLSDQEFVALRSSSLSPEEANLYVGIGVIGETSQLASNKVVRYEVGSWDVVSEHSLPSPGWGMTSSESGNALLAVEGEPEIMEMDFSESGRAETISVGDGLFIDFETDQAP